MPEQETVSAETPKKKRKIGYWIFLGIMLLVFGVQYLLAQSPAVCDWYLDNLSPKLSQGIGGLMSRISLPVCEICMLAAAAFCAVLLVMLILLIFLRKRKGYRRFVGFCVKLTLAVALAALISEPIYDAVTVNASLLGDPAYVQEKHDFDDLTALWNFWVRQANQMMHGAERDEHDHLILRSDDVIRAEIQKAAERLSDRYPRLGLPTPQPKTSIASQIVAGMQISAYYIEPWRELVFTVSEQSRTRYMSVYAHEYSHFCGYHKEDEANFLAVLLCLESDDPNIRYAGWLDVRSYIWNEIENEFFGDRPHDYEDPDYLAFTETTAEFDDYFLLHGDLTGNYKGYHKMRGEEIPEDTRKDNPEIISNDKAKELITAAGQKKYENAREMLGDHYYDGVVQRLLDYYADDLRADASDRKE